MGTFLSLFPIMTVIYALYKKFKQDKNSIGSDSPLQPHPPRDNHYQCCGMWSMTSSGRGPLTFTPQQRLSAY